MKPEFLGDAGSHLRVGIFQKMLLENGPDSLVFRSQEPGYQHLGQIGANLVPVLPFQCGDDRLDRSLVRKNELVFACGALVGSGAQLLDAVFDGRSASGEKQDRQCACGFIAESMLVNQNSPLTIERPGILLQRDCHTRERIDCIR